MSHISIPALFAALDVRREAQGLSWRDVARTIGLSASTFTRLSRGCTLDLDGYVVCCRWLGVSTEVFITGELTAKPENLAAELSTLLHRYGVPAVYWRSLGELIDRLADSKRSERTDHDGMEHEAF